MQLMPTEKTTLRLGSHDVVVTSPSKVYFPDAGITKLDVAQYYIDVADAALTALRRRPMILKRFVHGIAGEPFFRPGQSVRKQICRPSCARTK